MFWALIKRSQAALVRADRARDAGRWAAAAFFYQRYLEKDGECAPIWVQYGHALKESGQRSAAEAAYRKALSINPDCADTHLQLGHLLKLQGRQLEAIQSYLKALDLDRQLNDAYSELAALGWPRRVFGDLRARLTRRPVESEGQANDQQSATGFEAISKQFDISRELSAAEPNGRHRKDKIAAQGEIKVREPILNDQLRWNHNRSSAGLDAFLRKVRVAPFGDLGQLRARMPAADVIAVYALSSFPSHGLRQYHRSMLSELRRSGAVTILITDTGPLSPNIANDLARHSDLTIARDSGGGVIASWVAAVALLADLIYDCKNLVLLDDSVVGPMYPLADIFERQRKSGADMWSITDSWEGGHHLQTYFVSLSRNVVRSQVFANWSGRYNFMDDSASNRKGSEIKLTQAVVNAGMKISVLCEYREIVGKWIERADESLASPGSARNEHYQRQGSDSFLTSLTNAVLQGVALDPMYHFWDVLLRDFRSPFVARDLILANPTKNSNWNQIFELVQNCGGELNIKDLWQSYPASCSPPFAV